MRKLRNRSGRLVWIDHHASAIANPEYADLEGLRVDGRAACELTWEFFMADKPAPRAVRLAADRDVWTWRYGEQTAAFCEGIRLQPHHPEAAIWNGLLDDCRLTLESVIRDGTVCLRYQRALAADMIDAYGFETEIDGCRAYAVNCNLFGSDVFGTRYSQYELCACFTFDGSRYKVTLYSQSVDVLPIARRYGGGGHRNAAGFMCDELPFRRRAGRGRGRN